MRVMPSQMCKLKIYILLHCITLSSRLKFRHTNNYVMFLRQNDNDDELNIQEKNRIRIGQCLPYNKILIIYKLKATKTRL